MGHEEDRERGEARIALPPKFVGVPIPAALVARFQFVWTPASILKKFRFAWEWKELQSDIAELRKIEQGDPIAWHREWAERELDAAVAAWRGRTDRGPNPGKELDRLLLEAFEQIEPKLKELPPNYRLGLGHAKAENRGAYRGPVVLFCPAELPYGHYPATLEGLHQLLAANFGLTVSNAKMRISRARGRQGTPRRQDRLGRGRTRVPADPDRK